MCFSKIYHKSIIKDEEKARRTQEIEDKEKNHIGNLSSVISIIYSISKMLIVCPMLKIMRDIFPDLIERKQNAFNLDFREGLDSVLCDIHYKGWSGPQESSSSI